MSIPILMRESTNFLSIIRQVPSSTCPQSTGMTAKEVTDPDDRYWDLFLPENQAALEECQ